MLVANLLDGVELRETMEGEIQAMEYDFREHNAKLWAENKFVWVTKVKEEA